MDNLKCSIVKDLLPLYLSHTLREENTAPIENHLSGCENCREYKEKLEEKETAESRVEPETSLDKKMQGIAIRIKRRRKLTAAGVAALFVFMFILLTQVFQLTVVSGHSMEPAIKANDEIVINKAAYLLSEPKRGDIIICNHNDELVLKRIIGLPGESVEIKNGRLYINGKVLLKNYLNSSIQAKTTVYPLILKKGEYFVMGDNSEQSSDSRYADFGNVKRQEIYGKYLFESIIN